MLLFASVPPDIAPPGDIQRAVLEGGDVTLVCGSSVAGNPTPTISWTDNNGTTVSDGPEFSDSNTLMLAITSVPRSYIGNWTCNMENSVSNFERQIVLVVVGEYMCASIPESCRNYDACSENCAISMLSVCIGVAHKLVLSNIFYLIFFKIA